MPSSWGSILDVPGIRVGQAQRVGDGWLTGVSVVLPPPGTIGGVDVRGGGPGTHETDALDPSTLVPTVDAVVLTGGSAFGLVSAHGVQRVLEGLGRGFPVVTSAAGAPLVVPIVPAAAVFDLGRGGDPRARPDAALGEAAARAALAGTSQGEGAVDAGARFARGPDTRGRDMGGLDTGDTGDTGGAGNTGGAGAAPGRGVAGAGTGALVAGGAVKGGVGTAGIRIPGLGVTVGALAVVNAVGSPVDPVTGALLGRAFVPAGAPRPGLPPAPEVAAWQAATARLGTLLDGPAQAPGTATTLAVVATDARLDPGMTRRMATAAHSGLARAIDPAHTLLDGDTVFALATGAVPVPDRGLVVVHAAAATAVTLAIMDAVLAATATRTPAIDVPAYLDLCPGGAVR